MCSHSACIQKGTRFLYCSRCKGPVAKNNFATRHSHEGSPESSSIDSDDDSTSKHSLLNSPKNCGGVTTRSTSDKEDTAQPSNKTTSPTTTTNAFERKGNKSISLEKWQGRASSPLELSSTTDYDSSTGSDETTSSQKERDAMFTDKRRNQWLFLLDNRPATSNKEDMAIWLTSVLETSDPDELTLVASSPEQVKEEDDEDAEM